MAFVFIPARRCGDERSHRENEPDEQDVAPRRHQWREVHSCTERSQQKPSDAGICPTVSCADFVEKTTALVFIEAFQTVSTQDGHAAAFDEGGPEVFESERSLAVAVRHQLISQPAVEPYRSFRRCAGRGDGRLDPTAHQLIDRKGPCRARRQQFVGVDEYERVGVRCLGSDGRRYGASVRRGSDDDQNRTLDRAFSQIGRRQLDERGFGLVELNDVPTAAQTRVSLCSLIGAASYDERPMLMAITLSRAVATWLPSPVCSRNLTRLVRRSCRGR